MNTTLKSDELSVVVLAQDATGLKFISNVYASIYKNQPAEQKIDQFDEKLVMRIAELAAKHPKIYERVTIACFSRSIQDRCTIMGFPHREYVYVFPNLIGSKLPEIRYLSVTELKNL